MPSLGISISWSLAIFLKAPAIPSGLRVNCTELASARYSLCRLIIAFNMPPANQVKTPATINMRAAKAIGWPFPITSASKAGKLQHPKSHIHHEKESHDHSRKLQADPHVCVVDMP